MCYPSDAPVGVILRALRREGIIADHAGTGFICVDRTSCHNAPRYKHLHEFDILDAVLADMNRHISIDREWLCWGGKTDDFWFLEVYEIRA